eukprot:631488-Amphidinium_carterae.1
MHFPKSLSTHPATSMRTQMSPQCHLRLSASTRVTLTREGAVLFPPTESASKSWKDFLCMKDKNVPCAANSSNLQNQSSRSESCDGQTLQRTS